MQNFVRSKLLYTQIFVLKIHFGLLDKKMHHAFS
jgi:hypothetical protein